MQKRYATTKKVQETQALNSTHKFVKPRLCQTQLLFPPSFSQAAETG